MSTELNFLLLLLVSLLVFDVLLVTGQDKVWTRLAGSSGTDRGYGVTVDSTGSVYVCGQAMGPVNGQSSVGGTDIFLIKYASNGTALWTRIVGTSLDEYGYGVAVDTSSGFVYVTGQAAAAIHGQTYAGGTSDIILLKYASNGTRVWTRQAGTSEFDIGYGVAVDATSGAVYVCGTTAGSVNGETNVGSTNDIVTARAQCSGPGWQALLPLTMAMEWPWTHYLVPCMCVTGVVQAALNGQTYTGGINDIVLLKYASNGTILWTRMAGSSSSDTGRAVAVDTTSGSIYVTGIAQGSVNGQVWAGSNDIVLLKYASNGTILWTRMAGSTAGDFGRGVSVDSITGSVYVTGYAAASLHGQPYSDSDDVFLMKFAGNGTRMWTRMAGSVGSDIGYAVAIASGSDTVYVAGQTPSGLDDQLYSGGMFDALTLSYVAEVFQPSVLPTRQPTKQPTGQPSSQPTDHPTRQPTGHPTRLPSSRPTGQPSGQLTRRPSRLPTSQPTAEPSVVET